MANSKTRVIAVSLSLALSLWGAPARADDPPEPRPVDIRKPLVYSFSLMGLGVSLLAATGDLDSGPSLNNFTGAFKSPPEWDDDAAFFDLVLHPLWGSETYLRAREANWGIAGSIAFTFGMSVTWEYMVESWFEHPSADDLIFTTGIGWMIGELRYQLKQRASERWDWVIDPIHTTLEHLKVKLIRDDKGHAGTALALSWNF